jgi:alkanesulfonate monooxygenase SsuD/methylene tetrahydromethanopterin reductase-like flavin-dependent oxidoreductase (luciferase family)
VTCVVDDDPVAALGSARAMVAHRLRHGLKMLDTQPAHRHQEIRRAHELMLAGERERAASEVSEDLARSLVVAGGPDEVEAGIRRYLDAGCTRVVVVAYPRSREAVERVTAAVQPISAKEVPARPQIREP